MTTASTLLPAPLPTTLPASMCAIVQDEYGEPDQVLHLEELGLPVLGEQDVLVRVAAAGVDRGVWHLVEGRPYVVRLFGFGVRRPKRRVPGMDLAGTVVAVGASVRGFSPGDTVFGIGQGTFAEYASAPARKLARMPSNLSFTQAAVVPVSGLTALQAVRDHAAVEPGQRVLILGASGGVGTYAVQIAKVYGGHVTGVASGAKLDLVRALGADEVMDYAREDPCATPGQFDAIIDIGGNRRLTDLRRALTPRGRLVIVGGETDERWLGGIDRQLRALLLWPFVPQRLCAFVASENAADLMVLRELIESGSLIPVIDRDYPLAEAGAALRRLTDGQARGKIAMRVPA